MTTTSDQTPVRYFDYRPRYHDLQSEIDEAIRSVLESGSLILGPQVEAFEAELSTYVGAPCTVSVANGTDAVELALRALGVGDGDEVITVSNTAVASVAAIRATGAAPRFVDVRPDTLLIDADLIDSACGPRTRAILAVHLYGNPVDLEQVLQVARRRRLLVIEDCAQAFGTTYRDRHVGTFGDVGCFSFYPTKNLGAFGDGGACVTSSAEISDCLRRLRMYGFERRDGHSRIEGFNSRLDELQAAILRVKLRHVEHDLTERRRLANLYVGRLRPSGIALPVTTEGGTHSYHLFVVQFGDRQSVIDKLEQMRIGYAVHYPIPVHRMDAYRSLPGQPFPLPETEAAASRILSLPLYPGLTDDELFRVCQAIAS